MLRRLLFVVGVLALMAVGYRAVNKKDEAPSVTVTVERTSPTRQTVGKAARIGRQPPSRKPPSVAEPASLKTFDGTYFSVDYSGSWHIDAAEADKGSYLDTTFRSSRNPAVLVRVDVAPGGPTASLAQGARKLERALRQQPGYRRLDFRRTEFHGYPAIRWEFEVEEQGVLLRKVDVFFEDGAGHGYGVLTQAPAATYGLWRRFFKTNRESLTVNESVPKAAPEPPATTAPATPPAAPPPPKPVPAAPSSQDFCASHACIGNFDNGHGYVVHCADGMWSHSGGVQGACSYHGGVGGGSYDDNSYSADYGSSSDGYTEDYGSGNGYTVTCADGTLSDSGGIQGACSHHGGVG